MSNYKKWWVAVAGALAQAAIVTDHAVLAGVLPPAWVPWARVVVALGTALGVLAVKNVPGRHEAPGGEAR